MERPNILIFMTDHQRGDTVLRTHPAKTPHVDKLAAEGITFTNTFCPAPHCCPARATFASGLYPSRSGVWNNVLNEQALTKGLNPGVRLWSQDLADAGFDLNWSGKWHVSAEETPKNRGWNERFVSCTTFLTNDELWNYYRKIAEKEAHAAARMERGEGQILRPGYETYTTYGIQESVPNNVLQDIDIMHDETAVAHALDIIPTLAARRHPWVLYIGVNGPHDPYIVPKKYLDMYKLEDIELPASYHDELDDKPQIYRRTRRERWGQLAEREVRESIRHYFAFCTYLDELFGKVLNTLEKTGQTDNTLVLYTSDHGDYCGEHGLFAKGIPCFRGAYHVPAVIRWPSGIKNPGRSVDSFVSLADFAPTFLETAQIATSRNFTGASLVPFLRDKGQPPDWRDDIHTQCNGVELYYTQRSVMTKEYKYVYNAFDEDELYDLRYDPDEMKNVSADPSWAGVKRDMVMRMWQFAHKEQDTIISEYITVALAPYGPAELFR